MSLKGGIVRWPTRVMAIFMISTANILFQIHFLSHSWQHSLAFTAHFVSYSWHTLFHIHGKPSHLHSQHTLFQIFTSHFVSYSRQTFSHMHGRHCFKYSWQTFSHINGTHSLTFTAHFLSYSQHTLFYISCLVFS